MYISVCRLQNSLYLNIFLSTCCYDLYMHINLSLYMSSAEWVCGCRACLCSCLLSLFGWLRNAEAVCHHQADGNALLSRDDWACSTVLPLHGSLPKYLDMSHQQRTGPVLLLFSCFLSHTCKIPVKHIHCLFLCILVLGGWLFFFQPRFAMKMHKASKFPDWMAVHMQECTTYLNWVKRS